MNPSLIDLELMKLAIQKGYEFDNNTPKELLNNKDITLYILKHLYSKDDITYIINNASPNIIPIDLISECFFNEKYYINLNTPSYLLNNIESVKENIHHF